jgi:hypothetical protein
MIKIGLESLLVVDSLALCRNLKAFLCRVENSLDVLDQSILLLLQLGIFIDSLLDEELNISELAEIKVTFPLQAGNSLLESGILLLQSSGSGSSGLGYSGPTTRGAASPTGGASGSSSNGTRSRGGGRHRSTFSSGDGVVFVIREVEIPKALGPLQKLEVVLHLALDECWHGNGLVDLVLCESVYRYVSMLSSCRCYLND